MEIYISTSLALCLLVMAVCGDNQTSSNASEAYQMKAALNRVVNLLDNKITALQESDQLQEKKLLNMSRVLEEKEQSWGNNKLIIKAIMNRISSAQQSLEIRQDQTNDRIEKNEKKNDRILDMLNNLQENTLEITKSLCANYGVIGKDCADIQMYCKEWPNGVYLINPTSSKETKVYCEMERLGGGWTVIQKRVGPTNETKNQQSFALNYIDYENGFGDVNDEYWIGLRNIAALTAAGDSELRIEMTDWENNTAYAAYSLFKVGDSSTGYQLNIGNYSGTAGDSLAFHNNMKFSTKDKDQDTNSGNCAKEYKGAWWYNSCHHSNLNGIHASFGSNGTVEDGEGMWNHWKRNTYSLKKVTMMTRRKL